MTMPDFKERLREHDEKIESLWERQERLDKIIFMAAMIIAVMILVIVLFVFMVKPANALECHRTPGGDTYWSWRQVDGKKCWYRGARRISKERLHWSGAGSRALPQARRSRVLRSDRPNREFKSPDRSQPQPDDVDVLEHSVWPAHSRLERAVMAACRRYGLYGVVRPDGTGACVNDAGDELHSIEEIRQ
jgi:hypothetical protein